MYKQFQQLISYFSRRGKIIQTFFDSCVMDFMFYRYSEVETNYTVIYII